MNTERKTLSLGINLKQITLGISAVLITAGTYIKEGVYPVYIPTEEPWKYGDLTVVLYGDETEATTYI